MKGILKQDWRRVLVALAALGLVFGAVSCTGIYADKTAEDIYQQGWNDAKAEFSADPAPEATPTPTSTPAPEATPTPTSTPEPAPAEPELIEVPESVRVQLLTSAGTSKELFFYRKGEEEFRNGHSIPVESVDITLSLEEATYPVVGCYVLNENGEQETTGNITIEGSNVVIRALKEDTSYTIVLVYEAGFEMEAILALM